MRYPSDIADEVSNKLSLLRDKWNRATKIGTLDSLIKELTALRIEFSDSAKHYGVHID